ncbi:MAG: hypothetical protein R2867_40620 [Caldilineaceae bacterium]
MAGKSAIRAPSSAIFPQQAVGFLLLFPASSTKICWLPVRFPIPFMGAMKPLCSGLANATGSIVALTVAELLLEEALDSCFDGLDTFATVWLNGQEILQSDNMFVPLRVRERRVAQPGMNELHLLFPRPFSGAGALEAEHGKLHVWNGDASRAYAVRKAQYHYGWIKS